MFFLLKQVVSEKVGKLLVEVGAVRWLIWIKTVCGRWKVLLLMEEILHHLGCMKPYK